MNEWIGWLSESCGQTSRVRVCDNFEALLCTVSGHTALEMYKTFNSKVVAFRSGVGDVGGEINVESLRLFDHEYDVFPLEVMKYGRQRGLGGVERRWTAGEIRISVRVRWVVETRPRHDRNRVLNEHISSRLTYPLWCHIRRILFYKTLKHHADPELATVKRKLIKTFKT